MEKAGPNKRREREKSPPPHLDIDALGLHIGSHGPDVDESRLFFLLEVEEERRA